MKHFGPKPESPWEYSTQSVGFVYKIAERQMELKATIAYIIEKTKFEQVEQLQLEGFPANNYIYCIEPATGEKDSFDVGTYGMII